MQQFNVQNILLTEIDQSNFQTTLEVDLRNEKLKEELEGLAESIRTRGLLHPIIVTPTNGGLFKIVSGQRRFKAFQLNYRDSLSNETSIPSFLVEFEEDVVFSKNSNGEIISLIENYQRKDACMVAFGEKLFSLKTEYEVKYPQTRVGATGGGNGGVGTKKKSDFTDSEMPASFCKYMGAILGIKENRVREYLKIAQLPEDKKKKLRDKSITKSQALEWTKSSRKQTGEKEELYVAPYDFKVKNDLSDELKELAKQVFRFAKLVSDNRNDLPLFRNKPELREVEMALRIVTFTYEGLRNKFKHLNTFSKEDFNIESAYLKKREPPKSYAEISKMMFGNIENLQDCPTDASH